MAINLELWMAIVSVFIASCALGVTIWQGRQNHMHNKMSVRPKLTIMENYKDSGTERVIFLELINSGLGPAIIKNFTLIYEGRDIAQNDYKGYQDFLLKKMRGFSDPAVFCIAPGASILTGEHFELFSFCYKHGQDISFLGKLSLQVDYQSMYGDETWTCKMPVMHRRH
jgi:hypothetical protein